MEEEYNWDLIWIVAAPIALVEGYLFYSSITDFWKWASLIAALAVAGLIVYSKDKKKSNIFTAVAIVFLAALIVRVLKQFGFF